MGEQEIHWGSKTLLRLNYADDLSILDENATKMNEFMKVQRVHGARIDLRLKIHVKRISEEEKVMMDNENR